MEDLSALEAAACAAKAGYPCITVAWTIVQNGREQPDLASNAKRFAITEANA